MGLFTRSRTSTRSQAPRHGSEPETVTEEAALAEELSQLDREEPGWDRAARVAAAKGALRSGMSLAFISELYGQSVADEATGTAKEPARVTREVERFPRVLFVEDSPADLSPLMAACSSSGLEVLIAKTVEQALAVAPDVDLVLADLELPGDCYQVISTVCRLRPGLRVVSMRGSREAQDRARSAGAYDCLAIEDLAKTNVVAALSRIRR